MASSDILSLIAELAVTIAGFSSVVFALEGRRVAEWNAAQRFDLRVLLQVSALTVCFSILPLLLERVVGAPQCWRWAAMLVWHLGVAAMGFALLVLRKPQPDGT